MTCRDLADFLVDYLDGALPPALRQRFEAHLDVCPDCVNYLQQYRGTIRLVATTGEEYGLRDAPEDLVRAVATALRNQSTSRRV